MSNKAHEIYIQTLNEKIQDEFIKETPDYKKITLWRTELVELGERPEITPEEVEKFFKDCDINHPEPTEHEKETEKEFWNEMEKEGFLPTQTNGDFEFPLQDEPLEEPYQDEDVGDKSRER